MKNYTLLLCCFCLLASCNRFDMPNVKSDSHRLIKDSRVYILPVTDGLYRRTVLTKGYQDFRGSWRITATVAEQTLEQLKKAYDKYQLESTLDAELIEMKPISHDRRYDGFYVHFKMNRKRELIHMVVIDTGSEVLIIRGTLDEKLAKSMNEPVREAIANIYIGEMDEVADDQQIQSTVPNKELNIYQRGSTAFNFAGELDMAYYFSKDGNYPARTPDSAWISIQPIVNASQSAFQAQVFTALLGPEYEVVLTEYQGTNEIAWIAQKPDQSKMAIAALVWSSNLNAIKGSWTNNFDENTAAFLEMALETRLRDY